MKVHKFKRKRRFGASVRDRSPGLFMSELGRKAASHGGDLVMADTAKLKASQYRHDTDSYDGAPLSQRHKYVGGHFVLRDPYSAFVLRWAVAGAGSPADGPPRPDTPDRGAMAENFTAFLEAQTEMMLDVMEMYPGRPACFGF